MNIDDPIYWMNNTDPRLLDLWIAEKIYTKEAADKMVPAEQGLQAIVKSCQTPEQ